MDGIAKQIKQQRLGSVTLDESDKTEISPFDWCVSAIASRTRVTDELAVAAAKIESLEQSIKELKAQLDDFITTKEEDETQMLEKFRDLLNEKKLKIRKQQRLLSTAKADPDKLAELASDDQDVHHNAGPSRSGKRKVSIKEEEDDESDDGFSKMDVDSANTGNQTETGSDTDDENRELSTDNDATASDPDPDPDTDEEPPTAKRKGKAAAGRITRPKKAPGSKKITPPARSTRAATQKQKQKQKRAAPAPVSDSDSDPDPDDVDEDDAPPPPRALPFTRAKKTAAPPKPADDDETQSDEDSEL